MKALDLVYRDSENGTWFGNNIAISEEAYNAVANLGKVKVEDYDVVYNEANKVAYLGIKTNGVWLAIYMDGTTKEEA